MRNLTSMCVSLVALSLVISCGKSGDTTPKKAQPARASLEKIPQINLKKDAEPSVQAKRALADLKKNGKVLVSDIVSSFTLANHAAYTVGGRSPSAALKTPLSSTDLATYQKIADPMTMKVRYETALEKTANKPLVYNKDYTTIFDLAKQTKKQCYSGTSAILVVWAQARPQDFASNKAVVIHTPGHVLPGMMTKKAGKWYLTGIESTVKGKGRVDFGPAAELGDSPIRVARASSFMLIEGLKYQLDLSQEWIKDYVDAEVAYTASLYGIPKSLTKDSLSYGYQSATAISPAIHNLSVLGFGEDKSTPDGDLPVVEADKIDPSVIYSSNTSSNFMDAVSSNVEANKERDEAVILTGQVPHTKMQQIVIQSLNRNETFSVRRTNYEDLEAAMTAGQQKDVFMMDLHRFSEMLHHEPAHRMRVNHQFDGILNPNLQTAYPNEGQPQNEIALDATMNEEGLVVLTFAKSNPNRVGPEKFGMPPASITLKPTSKLSQKIGSDIVHGE